MRSYTAFISSKDVAESLGMTNISDSVASNLASDVEYRLNQVIEVRNLCHVHALSSLVPEFRAIGLVRKPLGSCDMHVGQL